MTIRNRKMRHRGVGTLLGGLVLFSMPSFAQDTGPKPEVDDEDAGKRLIHKSITDRDEELMARILRLMGEAVTRMELEFDPGVATQKLQRKIIDELDEAIKTAAARTRRSHRRPKPHEGDKRKMMEPEPTSAEEREGASTRQTAESGEATQQGRETEIGPIQDGNQDDVRRGWGALPDRQRDEVIQGFSEQFLEAYRTWIERYYRALQESDG